MGKLISLPSVDTAAHCSDDILGSGTLYYSEIGIHAERRGRYWECDYCGILNKEKMDECRGCGHPITKKIIQLFPLGFNCN